MRKSRFSENQIVAIFEQGRGLTTQGWEQPAQVLGMEGQVWLHVGLGRSQAEGLKAQEDENRRLKKLLAESMLDVSCPEGSAGKKRLVRPVCARLILI